MPHFKFPSHYVYWSQVKDHENIKSNVLPIINSLISENKYDNPFKLCKFTTDNSKPSKFLSDEMIPKIITESLDKMIKETNCFNDHNPSDFRMTKYWFNRYEKGEYQELHNHGEIPHVINEKRFDATFSMIYILHEEEPNSILFTMKDYATPFHPLFHPVEFDTSKVDDIKEGTVLVFSNHLIHTVLPVNVPGRTTIAFNVACCFE